MGSGLFDQVATGFHRAAGRQEIIDKQDRLPRPDAVDVNFQRVGTIFQLVVKCTRVERQLARLADRHEADSQFEGQRGGKIKPRALAAATTSTPASR